ncbi:a1bac9db-dbab-47e7-b805-508ec2eae8a3 [Sclerotinia trifoliorum]|uniref:A1bac9db-dbab-47e7-b805-508ec2eae8a3 n=1 Tax=Sclerotinia trifoliorum TaxID=28548 RepID=A0A8H2W4F3_9HELO|nr:a1bac9db-dbab-47e7-b805-508ec2eae8a3 [Sclerotinia trifoliorum]
MSAVAKTTVTEPEEAAQGESFLERPFRNLDFLVYRFVHPTDKRGLPYPDSTFKKQRNGLPGAKVWVGDFAPQWGEFLLDLGEPVYDVQDHHPLVTRLEGYGLDQGRVKHRNLQQLPFPWGIDGTLPVQVWANEVFRDNHCLPFNPKGMSRLDLQWECRRRLLPTHGKRSDLVKRINRLELPKGIQAPTGAQKAAIQRLDSVFLPLYRVLEAQPPVPKTPQSPLKQPPLDVGEIVLVYGTLATDENMCLVRDYEGNRGRISRDYLDEIQLPFGLKLNRRGLVELLEIGMAAIRR